VGVSQNGVKTIKFYIKLTQSLYHLDITKASQKLNIPQMDIVNKLNFLHKKQIVDLWVSDVTAHDR
jgi:hypothetical protein